MCSTLPILAARVGKRPDFIRQAKVEIKHSPRQYRHKETQRVSDGLDNNTPIKEVKGPSMFARVKEEVEAIIGTLKRSRKESSSSNVD